MLQPLRKAVVLIGPEGDFSENEIDCAKENGFVPVSLGKSILRTETAGIVACQYCNSINDY
jgi:16S rRNA (uracil1498-N3)-methyltransferase